MTGTPILPEEDHLLAAEYVLGVQDSETRALLELRIRREPAFAAAVAAWETRLEGLNDDFAAVPAPNLLPAIEARLFPVAPRRLRGWLFGLAGGLALVASLGLAVLLFDLPVGPAAPVLATLAAADLVYEVRSDGQRLMVTRLAGNPAEPGHVHEFWVIAPGAAPVSLGLLAEVPLDIAYPTPPAGWTLAVSIEPAGGSSTGAPTGPVILIAEIGV